MIPRTAATAAEFMRQIRIYEPPVGDVVTVTPIDDTFIVTLETS